MPYVDIILGTADAMDIVEILRDMMYKDTAKIPCIQSVISHKALRDTAYIDITYGCENYCTYCIVPFVRGKFRCRPLAEIVGEFNSVKDNAKNICLLGQNVNAYYDEKTGINFPKLLSILCGIDGDFNLKFLSSHPKDFDKELIEVIAKNEKISRDIHLPIQSGCDKILRRMNRQYTAAEYAAKVKMLRAAVPGIHITTDIICGFPGETEEDFTETVETVKILKFDAAYIFPYSRRSKTVADKMENQVPLKTRKARTTKLISIFRCMKK
jgi:tRNA-2-methylthio-N6-dimethylallyladenosine synthase